MSTLPRPTIEYNPQQTDLLGSLGRLASIRNVMQEGEIQKEQLKGAQVENQQRALQVEQLQRQQQDQQAVQAAITANPGKTYADILPSLQGKISPATWNALAEADQKIRKGFSDQTADDLKNTQAQHGMYQEAYNAIMNLPDEQVAQNWPQIAQRIDSIPGNKIQLDPSKPMGKAQLAQFGPFLGLNDAYLQTEMAKRKNQADAQKAESDAKKAAVEADRAGKVPGVDVPFSPEVMAQKKALKASVGVNLMTQNDAKDIADAIENGDQPPTLQGLYRNAGPVRAELARRGVPLAKMETDWKATQKYVSTLNGSQQVRLTQAVNTLPDLADKIEGLYNEWEKLAPQSGFKVLNKATLAAMKNLPGRAGAVAQALDAQIADAVSDLAVVYMGGNSPTDHGLGLAHQNLSADWNDATFREGLKQLRANAAIRKHSINSGKPAGASGDNSYFQQQPQQSAPQAGGFDWNKFTAR